MDDEQLQLRASALANQATTRIVAELGPYALPSRRDSYLAAAEDIAQQEIGEDWDFRISLDLKGSPYVFMEQYRG